MTEGPIRRPRGRPPIPREVQRARLLDAAARIFQKTEYDAIRVADVVREAGMSSRSFYDFFESKEDLAVALFQRIAGIFIEQLREVFRSTEDPVERMDRALRAYLDLFSGAPVDLDRLSGVGGRAGRRLLEARRETLRTISDMAVAALQDAYDEGRTRRPPDPIAVELLITGIEGIGLRYFAEGRGADLPRMHASLFDLMARALT